MAQKGLNSCFDSDSTMKTTIEIAGLPELVLQRAVEIGIARSKTDAIRLGVLSLNQQYRLVPPDEDELVVRKMLAMDEKNRRLGRKNETMDDVLAKYPHLKDIK